MKMQASPAVLRGGILDNTDQFLEEMSLLTKDEKISVLCM